MAKFAEKTAVSISKSQGEILAMLKRYGCTKHGAFEDSGEACAMFEKQGWQIKIGVPLPTIEECMKTDSGRRRTRAQAIKEHTQEEKQRWRSLALLVKGKLEGIERGASTFQKEFIGHVLLPDETYLVDRLAPLIESGQMPRLLEA